MLFPPVKDSTAEILSVTDTNKYHCCCSCKKKVTVNKKFATCTNRRMTMKLTHCNLQWSLKLYIQQSNKIRLSVYNQVLNKLLEICHINPSTTTDDEIIESVLDLELVKCPMTLREQQAH